MIYLITWKFIGSISMNLAWVELDQAVLKDFYLWKKRKNSGITDKHYIKGFIFGLLLGPFARPIFKVVNGKR